MSLSSAPCAQAITNHYKEATNLKTGGGGDLEPIPVSADGDPLEVERPPESNSFDDNFATEYDKYATAGVVPSALHGTENKSILSAVFTPKEGEISVAPSDLAQAFASYWATIALNPGSPKNGGVSVDSVSNNASSLTGDFKNAIDKALGSTSTSVPSKPYFQALIDDIESIAVSKIEWTIIEVMSNGTKVPFKETIS